MLVPVGLCETKVRSFHAFRERDIVFQINVPTTLAQNRGLDSAEAKMSFHAGSEGAVVDMGAAQTEGRPARTASNERNIDMQAEVRENPVGKEGGGSSQVEGYGNTGLSGQPVQFGGEDRERQRLRLLGHTGPEPGKVVQSSFMANVQEP